jgi:copper homeostasis protein (lipoprotein)
MRTFLTGSILTAVVLSACIEHRPPENVISDEPAKTDAPKPQKGLRVYEGTIPCADCRGIYQRLALKGDSSGVYRLTETYKRGINEDGDAVIVTTGAWKRFQKKTDSGMATIYYLSEGNIQDSSRIVQYAVETSSIVQLALDGESIPNRKAYTLKLTKREK